MLRTFVSAAMAAAALMTVSAATARAWGVAHAGYTHVGPGGVYHAGETAVATPYGARTTESVRGVSPAGGYHAAYGTAYRPPGAPVYGGYRPVPVPGPAAVPAYRPGVYRVP